jgi:hypothetical protein
MTIQLTVTNLTLSVATQYDTGSSKFKPLPPITLTTNQPQVSVTLSIPAQQGTLKVQVLLVFSFYLMIDIGTLSTERLSDLQ